MQKPIGGRSKCRPDKKRVGGGGRQNHRVLSEGLETYIKRKARFCREPKLPSFWLNQAFAVHFPQLTGWFLPSRVIVFHVKDFIKEIPLQKSSFSIKLRTL